MVFFDQEKKRLWYVRMAFFLIAAIIIVSAWHFAFAGKGLSGVCTTCGYSGYLTSEIPAKNIALTIDDGPDENTEKILSDLDAAGVQATFFLIGQNVARYPDITKDILAHGDLIGNHSFTHSKDVQSSASRLSWELSNTNKLIEAVTGKSARLYRPPYLLDMDGGNTVRPIFSDNPVWQWAKDDGYIVVGRDIDTLDWEAKSPDEVVKNVVAALDRKEADPQGANYHVMLLHGDANTAAAMPQILSLLKSRGYTVVPLTDLLGITPADAMPVSTQTASDSAFLTNFLTFFSYFWKIVLITVIFLTVFTLARPLIFIALKRFLPETKKREDDIPFSRNDYAFGLTATVLIPAYNEEKTIQATILSVLQNTRIPNQIIVLDDGSKDETYNRALLTARPYPFIEVVRMENGGKATALNEGIKRSTGDIVICVDSDTVFNVQCIERLLARFRDPEVGAVAGKVIPALPETIYERIQYLEYITGQNIDKEGLSRLGAVNVVPGAIGAWRRDVLLMAGGYQKDTIAEDQELTLDVLALGYKVVYEPGAIAYTEVPKTLKAFFLQRVRWMYGTFQCIWKLRSYLFSTKNVSLGWIALPYALATNILFPIAVAIVNIALVVTVSLNLVSPSILFILLFTLFDACYAFLAFAEEKKAPLWYLVYIPFQRISFMVLYFLLTVVVTLKVLDGSPTKWHKLTRSGTAGEHFFKTLNQPGS